MDLTSVYVAGILSIAFVSSVFGIAFMANYKIQKQYRK